LIDEIFNVIQDREYDMTSLVYSPDGKTIVTGLDCYTHEKGTVYLWNAKTGRRKRTLFKGAGGVSNVGFSVDGNRIIASGDWRKKTRVWDAKTGKELTQMPDEIPRRSKSLSHSPDGTATAYVQNGTVLIRKRETTSRKE
jgi:WD40 repeat protein